MNPRFAVNERFIGFFMLLKQMVSHSITLSPCTYSFNDIGTYSIDDVVAQCYYGAANMRVIYKGVSARIKRDNSKAIYI